ncbi:MAG: SpoIID/LytB domain-containing protein [Prevotella sp.]|nr:SpoIID/LytB domain-containing protein [Prevotella sp.]
MTAEILDEVLRECFNSEPIVDVGLSNEQVRTVSNAGGTTTIQGIRIGTSFHWEEQKALTYEGRMLLREDAGGGAAWLVNRIEAEKYLRSVIASEMAATSNLSLLKAHAVISRSWLVRRLNRIHNARLSPAPPADGEIVRWYDASAHDLFDVCADDHCQRYQGLPEKPLETVDRAIAETRGEVLIYAGRVIDARFSKCCGGRTEEYSYCWENIHPPYLVSVPDTRADGSAFCNTRDRDVLSLVLNDYDLRTSDFFDWVAEYTQADLSDIVETKQRLGLGLILSLEPLERGRSGRISRLKITGERGSIVVGKELEIRRTLSRTHLYSSCFDVETSRDPAGGLVFTLRGRGWGHGVGLCQIGAAVMGAEGYDYREILSHYYKGALVERIW